ncbi:MAG: proteasome-type protease [Sphingobium sp.]
MTYCVGMQLDAGLIFMSDTRTNAGVDNVSVFRKMSSWEVPGERVITILTSGNLATTQSVISQLEERSKRPNERRPSILEAPTMFQVANIVGETLRETVRGGAMGGAMAETAFGATLILGGQIAGMEPRLFMIYPEGNFIEASKDTPYFQTGETKYGRPILVRAYEPGMSFEEAAKLLMVSFDSTLKANLSVGLPFDFQIVPAGDCRIGFETRIEADDPYYNEISSGWGNALKQAFKSLPEYSLPYG